jgi:hypothetical protein
MDGEVITLEALRLGGLSSASEEGGGGGWLGSCFARAGTDINSSSELSMATGRGLILILSSRSAVEPSCCCLSGRAGLQPSFELLGSLRELSFPERVATGRLPEPALLKEPESFRDSFLDRSALFELAAGGSAPRTAEPETVADCVKLGLGLVLPLPGAGDAARLRPSSPRGDFFAASSTPTRGDLGDSPTGRPRALSCEGRSSVEELARTRLGDFEGSRGEVAPVPGVVGVGRVGRPTGGALARVGAVRERLRGPTSLTLLFGSKFEPA